MRSAATIVLCMLWLEHAGPAAIVATPENRNRLVLVGDSLSSGFGLDSRPSWVTLIERQMLNDGWCVPVINASHPNTRVTEVAKVLPALLESHRPAIVVLQLGGLEGLLRLPLDALRRDVSGLVSASTAAGADVLLIGVRLPAPSSENSLFRDSYQAIAKDTGAALVPDLAHGVGPEMTQADGLHLAAEAQPIAQANVWPALRRLLVERNDRLGGLECAPSTGDRDHGHVHSGAR